MFVFAYPQGADAIISLLTFLKTLISFIGIVMLIIGLVRLVISHAQEDPGESQKAAMIIGTAIALLILRGTVMGKPIDDLISTLRSLGH